MRKPAILILPPWYPTSPDQYGGIFIKEQAEALARSRRVVVLYIRLARPRDLMERPARLLPRLRIRTRSRLREVSLEIANPFPGLLPLRALFLNFLYRALYLLLVLPEARIQAIHAHSIQDQGFAAERLTGGRIPFFLTEHSSRYLSRQAFAPLARYRTRRCALRASGLFAVSPALAAGMAEKLGIKKETISIIPNIVNTVFFGFCPRRNTLEAPRLCAVCNLVPVKALDVLLKALSLLVPDFPGLRLRVAGSGVLRAALAAQIEADRLGGVVRLEGPMSREEVRDLLRESDILVLPSLAETFGVVLIEALATGMPVVATRCGGPEGIVGPGDGLLVEAGDPRALADGIRELMRAYGTIDQAAVRRRCVQRFGADAITAALESYYPLPDKK